MGLPLRNYFVLTILCLSGVSSRAQTVDSTQKLPWGERDTMIVSVIEYAGERIPFRELSNIYISNLSPDKLAKVIEEYNRLRRAVYVTYPYARTAGATLNDVAAHLKDIKSKADRKAYIKTREKELRSQFTEPLTNLSVYQGRVLMKLINRQTGNNCYSIIKEYKSGISARMYQTVAFFFSSSLKQEYDLNDATDRQIENFVKEIDGTWYNNPHRPIARTSSK